MNPESKPLPPERLLAETEWLRGLAAGLVDDPATADDLAQEVALQSLRDGERARSPRAWLATAVRRLRFRQRRGDLRRLRRETVAAAADALPSTDELVERAEVQRNVADALVALEEPFRTAVMLRYFEGLGAAEIARRQGVPAATVRSRLKRGLARLRERLDERYGDRRGSWARALLLVVPADAAAAAVAVTTGAFLMKSTMPLVAATVVVAGAVGLWVGLRDPGAAGGGARPADRRAEAASVPGIAGDAEVEPPAGGNAAEIAREVEAPPVEAASADAADRPRGVSFRVVDGGGRPLAGVEVTADRDGFDATTGPDGRGAALGPESLGAASISVELRFSKDGYAPVFRPTRVEADVPTWLGDVVLRGAGAVSGWVLGPEGRPAEGAEVVVAGLVTDRKDPEELRRHGPEVDRHAPRAVAGADGAFRIPGVAEGEVRVWAVAEGMAYAASGPTRVSAGRESAGLRLELTPLRASDRIAGVVLDPDGAPVAAAPISWFFLSGHVGTGGAASADAEGRFEIRVEHRAPHDLEVGGGDRWATIVVPQVEPGTTDLVLRFEEPRSMEVALVDPDGRPIERFSVAASYDGSGHGSTLASVPAAEHEGGVATFTRPTYPFDLAVDAPGYERSLSGPHDPALLPPRLTLTVAPLAAIRGVVRGPDGPIAGARVGLFSRHGSSGTVTTFGLRTLTESSPEATAESGPDGAFVVHLRGRSEVVVRAEKDGFAPGEIGPLPLDGAIGAEGLEVRLGEGGAIEGRVLVPPGVEPAGVILALNRGDGHPSTRRVGPDGRYRFDGLAPGPWQVLPVDEEILPRSRTVSFSSRPSPPIEWSVEVVEGATVRYDLDLRSGLEARLEGVVLLGGRPAAGAAASLADFESFVVEGEVVDSTSVDGAGRFRLRAPKPGRYRLEVRTDGAPLVLVEDLELKAGAAAWSVDVPVGSIRGSGVPRSEGSEKVVELRWSEPPGGPRRGRLRAVHRVLPEEDGTFTSPRMPAGEVEVVRFHPTGDEGAPGWVTLRTVIVEPNASVDLDLGE